MKNTILGSFFLEICPVKKKELCTSKKAGGGKKRKRRWHFGFLSDHANGSNTS